MRIANGPATDIEFHKSEPSQRITKKSPNNGNPNTLLWYTQSSHE
jgi:hypothetical protein